MVALPFATAVTSPPCVTVATVASLVLNAMPTPGIDAPPASRATAVSRTVSPRLVSGAGADGVNETDATGGRDGPPPPQASRISTANGQARRSGIHPPSADRKSTRLN